MKLHVATLDDGSLLLEFIGHNERVGVSLESNINDSSWYSINENGDDCGYFSADALYQLRSWVRSVSLVE
jgi:hypothetical protein